MQRSLKLGRYEGFTLLVGIGRLLLVGVSPMVGATAVIQSMSVLSD